ncbi:MAG: hypothetical protein AVDCRST_MAG19-4895 [uncultured Thermomicrobiales bacterium]|uniref:Uncharacterized protein n=1 Tax=uncultured Thermomicrobiales bacterium TaxID=1645740 RepID=A0A6J4VS06_9BACT|nr:MAG: hypothetical protein AVDCRST_MAG19-4895 [uncultured Thermomicrobiales bacterium]
MAGPGVEDFLVHAVVEWPRRLERFEATELQGVTRSAVEALRGSVPGDRRRRAALAPLLEGPSPTVGNGTVVSVR